MDGKRLRRIVKALLLAAGEPLSVERIQACFGVEGQPERGDIRAALAHIDAEDDGVMSLREVGGAWRLQIDESYAQWIDKLWDERPPRYSRALLETLALIIYRQPISRGEIEEIRGVSLSQSIIKTLVERGWIRVVGHRDMPGRPALFGSTRQFLIDFNLKGLDELPPLPEVKDEASLERAVAALRQEPERQGQAQEPADQRT